MRPVTCFAVSLLCAATVQMGLAQGVGRETEPSVRPVRQVKHISRPLTSGVKAAGASVTLPFWTATQGAYTYQMVGENPMVQQTTQTTTIPTLIVPLALTIANGTSSVVFDPTVSNACNKAGSALSLLQASPIFMNSTYTVGGTSFGSTLYHDFFQRANFWQYTNSSGTNPNYHMRLSETANAAIKITAPSGSSEVVAANCGELGLVDVNWLDAYLQGTVMPELSAAGVTPANFVVFLLNNVAMYDGIASDCCIIGYHSAFSNSSFGGATETYAVGDFDTSQEFGTTQDTAALSHEIVEWMDDPLGNNPTPPWGNIGQVTGCQNNLEVGDPLSGTDITVPMSNGFTYHLQELAFVSWFYHQSPSTGVNGWYSSNGTFTKPAGPCETSTTTLSISPTSLAPGSAAAVGITVATSSAFGGTPTGTVTLVQSSTSAVLATYTLSSGAVKATTTALPSGSYTVTANYAGDANFG